MQLPTNINLMNTMANHHHRWMVVQNFLTFMAVSCLVISCFCSHESHQLSEETVTTQSSQLHTHATVQLSSLFPSSLCEASSVSSQQGDDDKRSFLKVVHKHGPCARFGGGKERAPPTHAQLLRRDQSRVKSLQSMLSKTISTGTSRSTDGLKDLQASIPARSGSTIGSANYIVTVGLGMPKQDLTLVFDTGSSLTWTQCEPCAGYCHKQKDPIFNPLRSTSYTNISCTSRLCSDLTSTTGAGPACAASTCVYRILYGDNSFSVGFFAKDKLSLTPTDAFDNFFFGCGQNNQGLFGEEAGLLGLGRDNLSVVGQTAAKYGRYFSYCLPSTTSSTGYLAFGKGGGASAVFTPLVTISQSTTFYGIKIQGITVAGSELSIPGSIFDNAPSIIDSGTVITRLPPTAYRALSSAFQQQMARYPKAPAISILDTCYDLSLYKSVVIPRVSFLFSGGISVDLNPVGVLFVVSKSQVCLAFAPNRADKDLLIYGNTQQKGIPVVYDVAGGKLGFGPGGCA